MDKLCDIQIQHRNDIVRALLGAKVAWPPILLTGPSGSGKRTIIQAVAEDLGVGFREISLRRNRLIEGVLFGSSGISIDNGLRSDRAPGELGTSTPCVIYLSNLQELDGDLLASFERVLRTRVYADHSGQAWKIHDEVILIAGLTTGQEKSVVGLDHWLVNAFDFVVNVECPADPRNLTQFVDIISKKYAEGVTVSITDEGILSFFQAFPFENLHGLARCARRGVLKAGKDGQLDDDIMWKALSEDLRGVVGRLEYRDHQLTEDTFLRWAEQFPTPLRPLARHIVREIERRFYISRKDYRQGLQELIHRTEIPKGSRVHFCKWQSLGQSGPRVAHELKNQAFWKVRGELDLDELVWNFSKEDVRFLILADDFVGSGSTLGRLCESTDSPLARLTEAYPNAQVKILLIAGFQIGLGYLQNILAQRYPQVTMHVYRLFSTEDTCFCERSTVIPDVQLRERFKSFCEDTAREQFHALPRHSWLGYGGVGGLCVFFDTVPNNTLPIVWWNRDTWIPLFPVSGLPSG